MSNLKMPALAIAVAAAHFAPGCGTLPKPPSQTYDINGTAFNDARQRLDAISDGLQPDGSFVVCVPSSQEIEDIQIAAKNLALVKVAEKACVQDFTVSRDGKVTSHSDCLLVAGRVETTEIRENKKVLGACARAYVPNAIIPTQEQRPGENAGDSGRKKNQADQFASPAARVLKGLNELLSEQIGRFGKWFRKEGKWTCSTNYYSLQGVKLCREEEIDVKTLCEREKADMDLRGTWPQSVPYDACETLATELRRDCRAGVDKAVRLCKDKE